MHLLRTTFANEIVSEFLPPHLGRKEAKGKPRVILFCDGMPTMPGNKNVMEFFSKKGFWTFYPRYRGTWESRGEFLKDDPTKDFIDVIDELPKGFVDAWGETPYAVKDADIFVVGVSFGGPAALYASQDARVKKVISLSGVIDWVESEKIESMHFIDDVVKRGYGTSYRYQPEGIEKLIQGSFYNPINDLQSFDAKKIMLIHAADDDVVPVGPTRTFAQEVGCTYIELSKGKHISTSVLKTWRLSRKVLNFFNE